MKNLTNKDILVVSGGVDSEDRYCDIYRKDKSNNDVIVGRFYFPSVIYSDYASMLKAKNETVIKVRRLGKLKYFVECPDAVNLRSLDDEF